MSGERKFDPTHAIELGKWNKSEVEVRLPKHVELALLTVDGVHATLDRVGDDFRGHEISEKTITDYRQAVAALLKQRPSVATRNSMLVFSPRTRYFGPEIGFARGISDALRSLPAELKPKLGNDATVITISPDGSALLSKIEVAAKGRVDERTRAKSEAERAGKNYYEEDNAPIDAYERMLTQINRLQYALHEPIHIMQALNSGDIANSLQETFDPEGNLLDAKRIEMFAKGEDNRVAHSNRTMEGLQRFLLPTALPRNEAGANLPDEAIVLETVAMNEATMDIISEKHVRPIIRMEPALCLWLHNQFVTQNEAVAAFLALPENEQAAPAALEAATRLADAYGLVSQTYFTAFDTTDDARDYFAHETPKVLNRRVGGAIAETPRVSRVDHLNRSAELSLRLEQLGKKDPSKERTETHLFPSGKTVRFSPKKQAVGSHEIFQFPPISEEGVNVGATVYAKSIKNGHAPNETLKAFASLQASLEQGNQESTLAASDELERLSGETLSETDIEDLFGFAAYIPSGLGPEYPKTLAVHRAIMERLPADNPLVTGIYKQLFADFRETTVAAEEYQMLGFAPNLKEPVSWETVEASTSLGLYGFDMTTIPADAKDEIRKIYDDTMAAPSGWAATKSAMTRLGELKKRMIDSNAT